MKLSILVAIPALLAPVVAQKTEPKCAAQFIVDRCVKDRDVVITACNGDLACICQANKDKIGCYNDCPNDATNKGAAELQRSLTDTHCRAAEASKPATTTTVSAPKATSTTTGSAEHSGSSSDNHKSGSGSTTKSGSSSTSSSASISQHASFGIIALSVGIIAAFL